MGFLQKSLESQFKKTPHQYQNLLDFNKFQTNRENKEKCKKSLKFNCAAARGSKSDLLTNHSLIIAEISH